jgi:hypothetical protein
MKRLLIFAGREAQAREYVRTHWKEIGPLLREEGDPEDPPLVLNGNHSYMYVFDRYRLMGLEPARHCWVRIGTFSERPDAQELWDDWRTRCHIRGIGVYDQPKFPEY